MKSSKQFILTPVFWLSLMLLLLIVVAKSAAVECSRLKSVSNNDEEYLNELEVQNKTTDDDVGDDPVLEAFCKETCLNGYCNKKTGECICHDGYKYHIARNKCLPICEITCEHGQCLKSPHTCECDSGYEFNVTSKKCKPVCKSQCTNAANDSNPNCKRICMAKCISGKCFSPNNHLWRQQQQHHHHLYYQNVTSICNSNCGFGVCLESGGTCQCHEGYILNSTTQLCEPKCQPKCPRHSKCVLPNVCECDRGFNTDPHTRHRCKPLYSKVFGYSGALSHHTHVDNSVTLNKIKQFVEEAKSQKLCSPGYAYNVKTSKCHPICHNNCLNGNCSSPDVCICWRGYSMDTTTSICQPNACRIPCTHGYCTPDGDCICSDGYTKSIIRGSGCEPLFNHTLTVVFIFVCIMTIMLVIVCLIALAERRRRRQFLYKMDFKYSQLLILNILIMLLHYTTAADNWCTRTVDRTYNVEQVNGGTIEAKITRLERYCCEGYYLNNGNCEPVCKENCPNGKCVAPGECICNPGYKLNEDSKICQAICSMDCGYGNCTRPEHCECFEGYKYGNTSNICNQAICENPCPAFATCDKPNHCECNSGYRYNGNNTQCEPICESGCLNGICIEPDVCLCNQGYSFNSTQNNCQENICELPCPPHGYCAANGECDCVEGYSKSMFTKGPEVQCEERIKHAGILLSIFLACVLIFAIIIMVVVKCMTRKVDYEPQKVEKKYKMQHTAM
ncbi:uncharacterized protein [Musca autumnalis]|uniref:uncharacterized protein n=1 Tax=Musca autumnalis TaxID=221902 RepID=UPI003CED554C